MGSRSARAKVRRSGIAVALVAAVVTQAQHPVAAPGGSHRISPSDLLNVQVFNAPEFTRVVRVAEDGSIQMPLMDSNIPARGLIASELEARIADGLKKDNLLLNPLVSITVVEYATRPISVAGAVRRPLTFPVSQPIPLLDAIARAEGLSPEAGTEILITRKLAAGPGGQAQRQEVVRVSTRKLIDEAEAESNVLLHGGEEIRVPTLAKVYVFGNVRSPGGFPLQYNSDMSVLKALSLAGGLQTSTQDEAFVIRKDEFGNEQVPALPLRRLIDREIPDIPIQPGDILYVVENRRRKNVLQALDRILNFGTAVGAGILIVTAGR